MKRILVMEDNEEQRKKIEQLFKKNHYYFIAEDLRDAVLALLGEDTKRGNFKIGEPIPIDGVITKVNFPRTASEKGLDLYPYGIEIMIICHQKKIPFVVCTDREDSRFCAWAESMAKRLGAKGFIYDYSKYRHYTEDNCWEKALELLFS